MPDPQTEFGKAISEFTSVFMDAAGATSATSAWGMFEVRNAGELGQSSRWISGHRRQARGPVEWRGQRRLRRRDGRSNHSSRVGPPAAERRQWVDCCSRRSPVRVPRATARPDARPGPEAHRRPHLIDPGQRRRQRANPSGSPIRTRDSCPSGTAPRCWRCRTARRQRRAARRDRRSGRQQDGRGAGGQDAGRRARHARHAGRGRSGVARPALYRALCRLRLDCRACVVQRLPARLVTTPQTVHSFTRESSAGGARSIRPRCYATPPPAPGRSAARS